MEKKFYKSLEFDLVLEKIADKAFSEEAKEKIKNLSPMINEYEIKDELDILDETFKIIIESGSFPIAFYPIKNYVLRAEKGGVLSSEALLKIASLLRNVKQIKQFILSYSEIDELKNIKFLSEILDPLSDIEKRISSAIIDVDLFDDRASNELYEIRREKKKINAQIKEKLNNVIHSSDNQKYLRESIVTLRAGRYVIPVKSEARDKIKGVIHDTSSSGITVFIEPMGVVHLNNSLRSLEVKEEQEILRILKDFSKIISDNSRDIKANEDILIKLDVLNAKANYAVENDCYCPVFVKERVIDLKKASHPLIDKNTVVASDILLGEGYTSLIITGPNTGGKTVTLKTLGLAVLMAQSGLFIFAKDGSRLCIFNNIYSDIGDEQSISQSLSTFSSHMKNIVNILDRADEKDLVLLDELGAGTDPTEGAALATAILDELRKRNCFVMATTHYSEIKQYALVTDGVLNASVEFDVNTLSPTYRLMMGLPGKSNAFEISERLGLKKNILLKAKEYISVENKEFEDLIKELEGKVNTIEKQRKESEYLLNENKILNEELNAQKKAFEEKKENIILETTLRSKEILKKAKEESRKIEEELEELLKNSKNINLEKALKKSEKRKKELKDFEDVLNAAIPSHELKKDAKADLCRIDFKVGEEVYIPSLDNYANILGFDDKDNVFVQVGIIKTKVNVSKIEKSKREKENAKKIAVSFKNNKAMSISTKLDLRGLNADDAVLKMEKYLDDAYLSNLKIVTIVHGKGNGILRNTVKNALKKNLNVESYRIGGLNEGAEGATIVTLMD